MKKIPFCLALLGICIWSRITTVKAEETEKDNYRQQLSSKTEKYIQECSQKVYPENLDGVSMYNDDIKELDAKYHQCIKSIIISKINQMATKEDADKMIQSLNKIQESILDFYWDLYNREDNGIIGRGANDAVMGRYYEKILEDIIHFQH